MSGPFKAAEWWSYKIPPMLAVAYFVLAAAPRTPHIPEIWSSFALYILAVTAIASFGHFLTDAFDVEEDRVLGKRNLWAPMSPVARTILLAVLFLAAWLPWFGMPGGLVLLALIALQFLMFFLYAAPPVRLKERGLPGIAADAMYAHMLPALWTLVPFSGIAGVRAPWWLIAFLAAWSLAVGMRHLLQHQVAQLDSDRKARVRTFAVRNGREATFRLIVHPILQLEIVTFAALLIVIGAEFFFVPLCFMVFVAFRLVRSRADLAGLRVPDDESLSLHLGTLILSRFYERWLPLLVLAGLSWRDPSYVVLLVLHIALFGRGLLELARNDVPAAIALVRAR